MNDIRTVSFLGLGVMGYPMAGHLATRTDCAVTVYNRTPAKAEKWLREHGKGRMAATPREAALGADIVLLCVGNDDDLRHVLTGPDGVAESVRAGAVIVDHTTVSADISREMHDFFAARNVAFMDAPVSGGQAGAVNGVLTIMAGGAADIFDRVAPLLRSAYAREMRLMGPVGSGQITKMANQMCIAANLQGVAEALAFALKAGLNTDDVLAVMSKGSAQSWQMENRGATMVADKFDFGFAVDWIIKDLHIALEEAARNGARLEITPQILRFYEELSAAGNGSCDASVLIRRLRDDLPAAVKTAAE